MAIRLRWSGCAQLAFVTIAIAVSRAHAQKSVETKPLLHLPTADVQRVNNDAQRSLAEAYLVAETPSLKTPEETFKLKWDYQDEDGNTAGRFDFDIYLSSKCEGSKKANLCPKSNGCGDTTGDYDVTLPAGLTSRRQYSILITEVNTGISDCTGGFKIRSSSPTPSTPATPTPSTSTTLPPSISLAPVSPAAPTPAISCDKTGDISMRFSETSDRIYVEHQDGGRGGCVTLTDIYKTRLEKDGRSKGPLYVMDSNDQVVNEPGQQTTGRWLLTSSLYVVDGTTLNVWGTSEGGDADVLRIESTSSRFHNLRGHGGNLSFKNTKVTSWDNKTVRWEHKDGRSYISCVSEKLDGQTCEGRAKKEMGECRMDIIDTEIGWLGWFDSESYGLTWKVRGFCVDLSNPELFEDVNVYGDIKGSNIHDNYYGMYSYGHEGGVWTGNAMHDNHQYGFDPHDDSDYLIIANNKVWDNKNHGIIASKRCNNVKIYNNEVWGGEQAGLFLHRSSDNAEVYDNYVHDNADAGMAMLESFNADIYGNKFENNKYGIRISLGSANNKIHDNVFDACSSYGLYTYEGSDAPDVSGGRPSYNYFYDNTVSDTENGVKFNDGDANQITGNKFTGTEVFEFRDSKDILFKGNTYPTSSCVKDTEDTFTSDSQVPLQC